MPPARRNNVPPCRTAAYFSSEASRSSLLAAEAQPESRARRVDVLMSLAEDDPEGSGPFRTISHARERSDWTRPPQATAREDPLQHECTAAYGAVAHAAHNR